MQTLIIILIVVLIAQTVIFTYSNIVDDKRNKQLTSFQEQMKNAQADYIAEKRKFEKIIDGRDDTIHELIAQRNAIYAECEKLKNALAWRPSTEQIKSVYAAAGILSSMNEKTDSDHLMALWADLKAMHQRYKIGVDVGGGDDHSPEPPSFEESQGESGTNKA